ncbi:MAG: 30S ribosomal protein S15 [Candidatus Colwellbacteria bacterium RIFCSPHIGHO2_12_FULL_44_17]|uniref:Small ribosomal subunit protein uS15 n=1 Tax=Candidatus Colwellbacteria bacterium RIFCSPHIGHO2_12_FULL_44_17 TaxID=1797689 RepID=A0A1G1Z7F6_9BACT|nr:MAG: 30S ribosomal protein S15 [Candidatus Colwellbacteria bacterium RIFCSPHIGHO2_12_FULL_44_17]
MLSTRKKQRVIKDLQVHQTDTGSAAVQVGLLTEQIEELTTHLKKNKKDNHSRRGLLKMVSKRKTLLKYLSDSDPKLYGSVTKKMGLKK